MEKLRRDSENWINELSEYEKNSITKYTYNGVDIDGKKLFEKLNNYLEGRYNPINDKEEELILRTHANIYNAILKTRTKEDILVYRNDLNHSSLDGVINKFLSTSVTTKGVFKSSPNVSIIVPKGSTGAYVEKLSGVPNQREFLLITKTRLKKIYSSSEFSIYEVINNE